MTDEMQCNVCGGKEFVDIKTRVKAGCKACGSFERTRLLWMYLDPLIDSASKRILHFAPERGIYEQIRKRVEHHNYICADIDSRIYKWVNNLQHIDLCNLDHFPDNCFDVILHSHVLEHTPCNYAYSLFHLHRMLAPNGYHVCVIPFLSGDYDERLGNIPGEERLKRFGQSDHIRRYGTADINYHLGSVLKLPEHFDAERDFGAEALRRHRILERNWKGYTTDTVLMLRKYDMKLLMPAAQSDSIQASPVVSSPGVFSRPLRTLQKMFRK